LTWILFFLKHVIVKKKVNLKVLGMSAYVSKGVPQSCLDPFVHITCT
jgi:hypothetical protein